MTMVKKASHIHTGLVSQTDDRNREMSSMAGPVLSRLTR